MTRGVGSLSESVPSETNLVVSVPVPLLETAPPFLIGDGLRLLSMVSTLGLDSRDMLRSDWCRKSPELSEELVDDVLDVSLNTASRVLMRSGVASMPRSCARSNARVSDGY